MELKKELCILLFKFRNLLFNVLNLLRGGGQKKLRCGQFDALRAQFFCALRDLTHHCFVQGFVFLVVPKKIRQHLAKILKPPMKGVL